MSDLNTNPPTGSEPFVASPLTSSDFSAFFRGVHGHEPFPWQQRLTTRVLERGTWPQVIDLPTGAGKTAVLDTAVFALALRPEISPRRVVFVIDRRIVVDQVHERAKRIRDRVEEGATPILRRVRERLRNLSGGAPLGVAALRGGIPVDKEWTQRPDQPWVLVSTVDQFGSRLLFRGYGVKPGMRPIHAGLAGNDCLVILDEVHLSVPFADTLAQLTKLHSGPLPRRFAIVEMSATPSDKSVERFTLDTAIDLDGCLELRRRLEAKKMAKTEFVKNQEAIPAAVLKIIKSIEKSIRKRNARIRSIGVVVNRVRTARETNDVLTRERYSTHLITGRMRPLDRIVALERIGPIVNPDGPHDDQLAIVVATQAIEVGADFSFDAMIVECAAVDSLRQRFGRLDRRGTYSDRNGSPAEAWIIGPRSVVASKRPDPVYGDSVRATWEELQRLLKRGPLDVGPMVLRDFPDDATAPRDEAPLLLKTHMDAWIQTRPEPLVQPSIDWFLHGIDKNPPADISILWRWDRSLETLRLVPPRQAEFIEVPIAAVRSWLLSRSEVEVADVPQADQGEHDPIPPDTQARDCVRWMGFGDEPEHVAVDEIQPGDVLVVDPAWGGLRAGTWDPSSKELIEDLGDAAQIAYGRRATLRLDPQLFHDDVPPRPADEAEHDMPLSDRLDPWLKGLLAQPTQSDWIRQTVERLRNGFTHTAVGISDDDAGAGYYILTEKHDTEKPVLDTATIDGSDESSSLTGTGVRLDQHLEGVGERAADTAQRLGVPSAIVEDIRLAGRLHDLGKVDRRFQLQLVGGDPVEMERRDGQPLAKSLPNVHKLAPVGVGNERERRYPKGMRHEVASVVMIESNGDILDRAHDKDLVLHLVGTHHGWGRPLPPIIEDPKPQMLRYELDGHCMEASSDVADSSLALDMAERFWRLVARYGYHGLAWLEAILRLADHRQSAEEAKLK